MMTTAQQTRLSMSRDQFLTSSFFTSLHGPKIMSASQQQYRGIVKQVSFFQKYIIKKKKNIFHLIYL